MRAGGVVMGLVGRAGPDGAELVQGNSCDAAFGPNRVRHLAALHRPQAGRIFAPSAHGNHATNQPI